LLPGAPKIKPAQRQVAQDGFFGRLLVDEIILAINFAAVPNAGTAVLSLAVIAVAALAGFGFRERRARFPLYDLRVAGRRIFWVAACAGIIVFGSLMGAMFIGQQFLQDVLGYSTIDAGLATIPAAVFMVLIALRSAKLVESHGARFTLLTGYLLIFFGFRPCCCCCCCRSKAVRTGRWGWVMPFAARPDHQPIPAPAKPGSGLIPPEPHRRPCQEALRRIGVAADYTRLATG
jgi:hypothetical protein